MGTSTSAAQLAGKMNSIAAGIPKSTVRGVKDSSLIGKRTIEAVAASRGVPPRARIAGRPWSVGYTLTGGDTRPRSLLRIRGAFPLVESDTPSHRITARRGPGSSGRRRTGKKALVIGGNVRASADHPGTRGKHVFRDAKQTIIKQSPPTVMGYVVKDIRKVLG